MSKELTPRTQAIRTTLFDLVTHINQFIGAVKNISRVLDGYEWWSILLTVFAQLEESLTHLAEHTHDFSENASGHEDEILRLYHVDKSLRKHLERAHELIQNIQKVYGTSSLDHATRFALIDTEIARIRRTQNSTEDIYITLKAHYADVEWSATMHLESTKKYKKLTGLESQIWYIDLHSKL